MVDIGAGTTWFSKVFYNLMEKGIVYALDISTKMIQWIQEHIYRDNKAILPIKTPFAVLDLYHYIHYKNKNLAKRVNEVIINLINSGELVEIVKRKEKLLISKTIE